MFKSNEDYEKLTFKDSVLVDEEFETIVFENCTFTSCDFSNTKFLSCEFVDCIFEKCNLSNTKFPNSVINGDTFQYCKMIGIDFTISNSKLGLELNCTHCDLNYTNFKFLVLAKSIFNNCTLKESDFSNSNCKNVSYEGSDLLNALFSNTDLRESSFIGALNYVFNPNDNKIKDAKFSRSQVLNLLLVYKIKIED